MPNENLVPNPDITPKNDADQPKSATLGFQVVIREFLKDKVALAALVILITILLTVFIGSLIIDEKSLMRVDVLNRYIPWGQDGYILGTDEGGRDIFGQLIIGARNSILIGFGITILTSFIGIVYGLISGYFGGIVDVIMMRIVDFIMILPTLMIIIVLVTIVPHYTVSSFIMIMSAFYWTGKARLIRSRVLSEASLDYVSASQTLGSSHFMIMFREVLPNISSIIIVNLTLSFAGNLGIETGLSYLGFGLPPSTPSLGTLVGMASSADIIENKQWVWLPASLLILVMMLCINYIGQAMQRVADSKQRLG
nr:ABC transporter permease [Atopobacter phocae]